MFTWLGLDGLKSAVFTRVMYGYIHSLVHKVVIYSLYCDKQVIAYNKGTRINNSTLQSRDAY